MKKLQIKQAYDFYKKYILQHTTEKSKIYTQYGFTLQGSVGSKDWEVFAAILLDDKARPGDGADLMNHEVKSAIIGSSFEYQYHKFHGVEKLEEDRKVDHVFIARGRDYLDIEIWLVNKLQMIIYFDAWLPELLENYKNNLRQRFRRSVPYSHITQHGKLILTINEGKLIYSPIVDLPKD
ncbi:MAG: hypothetical protein DWQ04_30210 [Chloroflexi bacterium]|nr:MAG: hypothetical protein DWQ04_30210 [Chloroflexota bacterium]